MYLNTISSNAVRLILIQCHKFAIETTTRGSMDRGTLPISMRPSVTYANNAIEEKMENTRKQKTLFYSHHQVHFVALPTYKMEKLTIT